MFFTQIGTGQVMFKKPRKPVVDTSDFANWQMASSPLLSHDGRFVSYEIRNKPRGSNTVVILATNSNRKREFINIGLPEIHKGGGTLYFYRGPA